MELDVNKGSHDFIWRLMSPDSKKRYLENFGPLKAVILDREIARLIQDGFLTSNEELLLTSKGKELYRQLTRKGCCQPG